MRQRSACHEPSRRFRRPVCAPLLSCGQCGAAGTSGAVWPGALSASGQAQVRISYMRRILTLEGEVTMVGQRLDFQDPPGARLWGSRAQAVSQASA